MLQSCIDGKGGGVAVIYEDNGSDFRPVLFIELEYVRGSRVPVDEVKEEVKKATDLFSNAGVSHNDIHKGNIIHDRLNNKMTILDFDASVTITPGQSSSVYINP